MPFFTPFYLAGNRFTVVAPDGTGTHIRDILSGQQNVINFPVSLDYFQARLEYMLLRPGSPLVLGAFRVQAVQLNHPGMTVGYRIEADGCAILTIEGLAPEGHLGPLQEAFVEHNAVQCGFCTPGMLMSAHALLQRNPDPSEEQIKQALVGNLCRCTGYVRIIRAVRAAAEQTADAEGGA